MDTSGIAFLHALQEHLGVPVVTKVPRDRPDTFVRVDFGSGRATSPASEDRLVAVQVYSTHPNTATALIFKARMFLLESICTVSPKILWWEEQAGPHEWADPDIPAVTRWQITGNVTLTLT